MGLTRKNIDALAELGDQVVELEERLRVARVERGKVLVACYLEGWTWDELTKIGRTSLASVRKYVLEAGVLRPPQGRTEAGRARKAAQRASKTDT
ncbi:hypothetical protein [Rhodococcoides corynebacterioides]|uniref:Helix-turn-helix domain-containing protein n=1 Tax=Rhodococcoides corynebacterioides TaxID=53972 RepID=A0ABS7P3K0_9NOCA|nr:hypothetical protein [Rhodococcus corynebacterioides]MBY6366991.1 hypothetical protein [Rhodococcus corynebacterioides]MBY6407252.1 hypothetical protein [Rhodococcus corynebacterioides]